MWCIDKYRIERYTDEDGNVQEKKDLVETLEFEELHEANMVYRNERISYGAGAVYFMLDQIYETTTT